MLPSKLDRLLLLGALAAFAYSLVTRDTYFSQLLIWCCANALMATAMRFMMLVGEFNMATVAFYGMGAYVAGYLTTQYDAPFLVSLIVAGTLSCIVGVAFGYISLRIKGAYFMLVSFAFAEVARLLVTKSAMLGGNSGIVGIFPPAWLEQWLPPVTVVVVVGLCALLAVVECSSIGKVFTAIRNNDAVVEASGISVLNMKVLCLALSVFAAGIGGSLYAFTNNVISPGDFNMVVSVMALAGVKLGGEHDFRGPIIGAILLTLIGQYVLRFGALQEVFYGGAILVSMLLLPGGVMGALQRWRIRPAPLSAAGTDATKVTVKP